MTWLGRDLQSTGLEKILIVFLPCGFGLLRGKAWAGFVESAILVDLGDLLDDVVVESTRAT